MQRTNLKLAIVGKGFHHWQLAVETNRHLPSEQFLSELNITQFVTFRKNPTPEQAAALAHVLGQSVIELFSPEVKQ